MAMPDAKPRARNRWPARLCAGIRLRLENPWPGLIQVPLVALLLVGVASLPPSRRIDDIGRDLVVRHLPVRVDRAPIVVLDLEQWSTGDLSLRAALRIRIATLLEKLEARADLAIGLDVVLASPTDAAADARLAEAIDRPRVVVASEIDAEGGEPPHEAPLAEPFAGKRERGIVNLVLDRNGIARTYGIRGMEADSLALRLARIRDAAAPLPTGPVLLHWPWQEDPEQRWIVVPASSLLEAPGMVDELPRDAVVLIGVAGSAGQEHDGVSLKGPDGTRQVAGVFLHARVLEQILGREFVVAGLGGTIFLATTAWLLLFLAAGAGVRAVRRRPGRPVPPMAWVLVAVVFSAFAFVPTFLVPLLTGTSTSLLAMTLAPFVLLGMARYGAQVLRWARFLVQARPLLGSAPEALVSSVRRAFQEESPVGRLVALLDAYEDLVHWLAVCLLAAGELPRKRAGELADNWNKQHTLQTQLAALRILSPEVHESLLRWSCDEGLRRSVQVAHQQGRGRGAGEPGPGDNQIVRLRNTIAHDTSAWWLTERDGARFCAAIQRRVIEILGEPRIASILGTHAIAPDVTPAGQSTLAPVWMLVEGRRVSAFPWLAWATGTSSAPRLLRYRGVARRKSGPGGPGGTSQRVVVYSSYGPGGDRRMEIEVAYDEVASHVPEILRREQRDA